MGGICEERVGLIVPTLNAGRLWDQWLKAFAGQTFRPKHLLVIDSSSTDQTCDKAVASGFRVHSITRDQFDHGGTRLLAASLLPEVDYYIFLTQDAILASPDSISRLLDAFSDERIAASFGRQLPARGAGWIESHSRRFNYPGKTTQKGLADKDRLGLKTPFFSNSFSAYRADVLHSIGGFPAHTIGSEDIYVAALLLKKGYRLQYAGQATVYHSHRLNLAREFSRYFDIGVFYGRERWIRELFGTAEGEGRRFLLSELGYLKKRAPFKIPEALLRSCLKYIGYKVGYYEQLLPRPIKKHISYNQFFWEKRME